MNRWIAVSLSVVLAVSALACDSESSDDSAEAAEAAEAETEQSSLESDAPGAHRTRTGLQFETPTDWSTEMMPAGAQLVPPDGPETDDNNLLVIRFAPDDATDATDDAYLDKLAADFNERIGEAEVAVRETGLDSPMGPASYIAWNIEDGGETKRVGFYVTIDTPWMLVLRATGPRSVVEQRREKLQSIFASADLTEADTVSALVGTWRRARPHRSEKGTFHQTLTFEEDGTLRLTHDPVDKSDAPELEDLGRWAATDETLTRYVGDSLRGGVQLKTHDWTIDETGILQLEGDGETTQWERLD